MKSDVLLKKLLISQMVMEGMSMATIDFFKNAYGILVNENGVGCPKMAEKAFVTRQNANLHCNRLERAGYLERKNYRSWRLSSKPLHDADLVEIGRAMSVSLPFYTTEAQIRPVKSSPKRQAVVFQQPKTHVMELVFF